MNSKWYIGTFILILALFGLNQGQTKVANQQIILEFTGQEAATTTNHDEALAAITEKLGELGIANIEIIENDDEKITIRYYSDIDAFSVDKFLSQNDELSLAYSDIDELPHDFPEDKLPESFSLVVSDIHQQSDDGLSLNGKFASESKRDDQRFSGPVVTFFNGRIIVSQILSVAIAFKRYQDISISINNTSKAIPEVRAGPHV
ncbi:hypothetical protein [Maribacter sp. 2210JD10-5]|uniref:hypothetical protein n=1 Tax=Maribacter sp. 2210JD10-5 TaxID=3386272 RepID=UPI0039BD0C8D